jgi:hypothetical protein
MSDEAFLSFELLGVAFSVTGDPGELKPLLEVRYEAAATTRLRKDKRLAIRVDNKDSGWEVTYGERPPRTTPDATEALDHIDACVIQGVLERRSELAFAHAGVIAVGGLGVVLPGLARTGKSVLVLALIQGGARFLSDELLICDNERAIAFPRAISMNDEGSALFPDLAPHFRALGSQRFLPTGALGPESLASDAILGTIVVPIWDPAQPDEVLPMPRTEAVEHLIQSEIPTPDAHQNDGNGLADACSAIRSLALRWRDPHSAATLLLDALS